MTWLGAPATSHVCPPLFGRPSHSHPSLLSMSLVQSPLEKDGLYMVRLGFGMAVRELDFPPAFLQLRKLGVGPDHPEMGSGAFVGPHPDSPFKPFVSLLPITSSLVSASASDLVPPSRVARGHFGQESKPSRDITSQQHAALQSFYKAAAGGKKDAKPNTHTLVLLAIFRSPGCALKSSTFPQLVQES